ncbi:hypothetical protein PG987_001809 [Apiospora arundinis]
MMVLLYETIPAFEVTWMECLGGLGRYRMAIEDDDLRDREVWTSVSQRWYSKASDVVPYTGRLYHHLAILARPNALKQLFYYSKALSASEPFESAWDSIMTLFDPLLGSGTQRSRLLPIDFAFVKAQGIMLSGKRGDECQTSVTGFLGNLDNHTSRTTRNWMESGYYIGISNCCALLCWGKESSSSIYETVRTRRKSGSRKEDDEQYKNREIPTPTTLTTQRPWNKLVVLPKGPMSLLETTFTWKLVSALLNSFLHSYHEYERIQSDEFPRPVKQSPRPLPEYFALRGLVWADTYFPPDWFSNNKIDDDEKYFEVASMTDKRKERVL